MTLHYRRSPTAKVTEFHDNAILLDLTTDTYYALNTTGLLVWRCLEDGQSVEQTASSIASTFHVDKVKVSTDVERIVQELLRAELLKPVESG